MARLASQSKGGFYATPPEEMALVCQRLRVKAGANLNLLDPCAGEGEALRQMAEALAQAGACPETYGVELEIERAQKAKALLGRVVKGGYEWLRASNGVFSALWLNPPYDLGANGERIEVTFLRDLTAPNKYLQNGGLLMLCIPQHVLAPAAPYLAIRFRDVRVYRFTDRNYPVFKQVIVFGYREKMGGPEAKRTREWLQQLGQAGPEALLPLDAGDGIKFTVPAARGPVTLFRGSVFDPEEVISDVEGSGGWEEIGNMMLPAFLAHRTELKNPLLPLKLPHVAIAISARAVDGNMGTHILEGVTKKVVDQQDITDEKGTTTILKTERHVTTVRVFSPEGVFDLD